MIRISFLIRSMGTGGAERQLIELVRGLDKREFDISVVLFYSGGGLFPELSSIPGIRVHSLEKRGRWDIPGFLWRLVRFYRAERPALIHGYLSGANELALLAGWCSGARAVWGIRNSDFDMTVLDWLARLFLRLGAALSRCATLQIANSHRGRDVYAAMGFHAQNMIVIWNGIDTRRFHPDAALRSAQRAEWGLAADERLIAIVGRIDPQKDHATFLRAAARFLTHHGPARFALVGDGPAAQREALEKLAHELGVFERIMWVRECRQVERVYNAADLCVSTSRFGEGFPNVIAEAMACATPCAVTDCGDSPRVLGEPEWVAPIRDPQACAETWARALAVQRETAGARLRRRVETEFSVAALVERTGAALKSVARGEVPGERPAQA